MGGLFQIKRVSSRSTYDHGSSTIVLLEFHIATDCHTARRCGMVYTEVIDSEGKKVGSSLEQHCIASRLKSNRFTSSWLNCELSGFTICS